tara:strand:- start:280 stop:1458 length:1179 start_codon:yes stop_codon:yes gene_type:complete
MKYPYARPEITEYDRKLVLKVLHTTDLTQGKYLKTFEKELEKKFKCKHVVVCNSGTAALHIVYSYLGLNKSNSLLTTPLTFVATANAAVMNQAKVFFSDVNRYTGLIDAKEIEKVVKKAKGKVKVISVVHLGGRLCQMAEIKNIADKYNCHLVEDACHAIGASYTFKNQVLSPVGSCKYSIATTFSFHAIKHVAMGEGGCIATNSKDLANFARNFISHGINRDINKFIYKPKEKSLWYYEMVNLGYNYRVCEMSCALGLGQLKRLKKSIKKRIVLVKLYNKYFKNIDGIVTPELPSNLENHAWHLYSLLIDFKKLKISRALLMRKLFDLGIGTQVHYIPVNTQPFYRKLGNNQLKNSTDYYQRTLSLPLYSDLNADGVKFVVEKFLSIIKNQ